MFMSVFVARHIGLPFASASELAARILFFATSLELLGQKSRGDQPSRSDSTNLVLEAFAENEDLAKHIFADDLVALWAAPRSNTNGHIVAPG